MKIKGKYLLILVTFMTLLFSVSTSAASFTVKKSGVTTPSTLNVGASFSVKGTLKGNQTIAKVVVSIIRNNKQIYRYEAKPYSKTFNLANADSAMAFNKLPAGSYIYRISAFNSKNKKKAIENKKFTVKAASQIKITNPSPAKDFTINKGSGMVVGGKITSKYKIVSVTAKIINSSGKAVQSKTVAPKATSYNMTTNKTIDNAMRFDTLSAGSYKFQVSVTDEKGTTVLAINRKCTVKSGNVSGNAVGSGDGTNQYSDVTGTISSPAGFTPRTTRPSSSNSYYYNSNYNIYYKYDSLAPTGRAVSGGYVIGNCTWYACGRAMEIAAKKGGSSAVTKVQSIFGGDPVSIFNMNKKLKKFNYGSSPKPGSIAVFNYGGNSGDAHVAIVEAVVNGVPFVSESGYKVSSVKPNSSKSNVVFWYQSIYAWSGGRQLLGYIYLV